MRNSGRRTRYFYWLATVFIVRVILWTYDCSAGTVVSEDQIQRAVEEFVLSSVTQPKENVQVSCRRQKGIELEGDGQAQVVVSRVTKKELRGIVPVKVEVWLGGVLQRRLLVTAEIRFLKRVLVAARRLDRHEELTSENLKFERRDVTDLADGYFTEIEELEGKRTRRPIPFNRIITERSVETIPVVARGAKVMILAQIGNVIVSARGTAREDGGLGDRIKVVNDGSKARLIARVIDAGTVEVIF